LIEYLELPATGDTVCFGDVAEFSDYGLLDGRTRGAGCESGSHLFQSR
jgi:hypothetical protein